MRDNWLFIVNPSSGSGRGAQTWEQRISELRAAGMRPDAWVSEYPGNVEELVAKAAAEGYRKIASYGGDGTLSALVNGAMRQSSCSSEELLLAHLSCGTGNDWCRTFGVPKETGPWVAMLRKGLEYRHDVGIADVVRDGGPYRHYFINIVGMAYDSLVVRKIDDARAAKGLIQGKLLYEYVVSKELFTFRAPELLLRMDGAEVRGRFFNLAIGICRFNGNGMMPTPFADPSDGLLDVTTFGDMPLWMIIRDLPKMRKGTIFSNPNIKGHRASMVEVEAIGKPDLVEADGDSIGQTPARFSVARQALRFIVERVPEPAQPHFAP